MQKPLFARRWTLATAGLAAALGFAVTACGSQSPTGTKSNAGGVPTISIGVSAADPSYLPVFTASVDGSFKRAKVNVKVSIVGSTVIVPELVSGQIDLALVGTPSAFAPVQQGLSTKLIYAENAGEDLYLVGGPGVTSVNQCKHIISGNEAGGVYSQGLTMEKALGAHWTFQQEADVTSRLAALEAGQPGTCGQGSWAVELLTKHGYTLLINPNTTANLPSAFPKSTVDATIMGVTKTLDSNRIGVERFLKGYQDSVDTTLKLAPAKIASLLVKDPLFAGETASELEPAIAEDLPNLSPNEGYISPAIYSSTIHSFGITGGGLEYLDSGEHQWTYDQRVDMSFYDSGIGKPKSTS